MPQLKTFILGVDTGWVPCYPFYMERKQVPMRMRIEAKEFAKQYGITQGEAVKLFVAAGGSYIKAYELLLEQTKKALA